MEKVIDAVIFIIGTGFGLFFAFETIRRTIVFNESIDKHILFNQLAIEKLKCEQRCLQGIIARMKRVHAESH